MVRRQHLLLGVGCILALGLWWQITALSELSAGEDADRASGGDGTRLAHPRVHRPHTALTQGNTDSSDDDDDDVDAATPSPAHPPRKLQRKPSQPSGAGLGGKHAAKAAKADVQLFIIWHGAMSKRDRILQDIRSRFRVFHLTEWTPQKDLFQEDLWRLYWGKGGFARKGIPQKVKQCGGYGKALVVLVVDEKPEYKTVETAHGDDYVNANMHDAKYRYRKMSGGGFKVHGTYSVAEAEHDSFVIHGKTARELLAEAYARHGGHLPSDVAETPLVGRTFGRDSWPTCERLYKALSLVTDQPVDPGQAVCEAAEADGSGPALSITARMPRDYDKTVDIRAAIVAMVYGEERPEQLQTIRGIVGESPFEFTLDTSGTA